MQVVVHGCSVPTRDLGNDKCEVGGDKFTLVLLRFWVESTVNRLLGVSLVPVVFAQAVHCAVEVLELHPGFALETLYEMAVPVQAALEGPQRLQPASIDHLTSAPRTFVSRCRLACAISRIESVPKASAVLRREQLVSAVTGLLISRV